MPLRLFEGWGVELEYMIVSREDLSIMPVSDKVLTELAGTVQNEVEVEEVSWSNELVLHVLELKNTEPVPALSPLGSLFSDHVNRMNARLEPMGAMLLPSAMHPFMQPEKEARLWPHEGREIYQAFDRVFDCKRHGWANLQSVQVNLSFADDEEFGRLHSAIRLVLPILAPIAASSPVVEGELSGLLDTRLEVYRTNARRVPATTGSVIPEPVFTEASYEKEILEPLYREIEPLDPDGTLRHPWLNARGAIAQFSRDAIEIRVLDMQECPAADIAVCSATAAVVKALVDERWTDQRHQRQWRTAALAEIFVHTLREADQAVLADRDYLRVFGFPDKKATAQELWMYLIETLDGDWEGLASEHLKVILEAGPLARRLRNVLGGSPRREDIGAAYRALADSLVSGRSFVDM